MNEDFVSFKLALKLKDKGFDKFCENGYFLKSGIEYSVPNNDSVFVSSIGERIFNTECCWFEEEIEYGRDIIYAPTISQVLKWMREEKNLYCLPFFEQGVDLWLYVICKPAYGSEFPEFISESDYDTYEQAAIAGVNYCLENLI